MVKTDGTTASTPTPAVKAPQMRADKVNEDIKALMRARNTLIWIVSKEEHRVEDALVEAAGKAKFETCFWDCATGVTTYAGKTVSATKDPGAVLKELSDVKGKRFVYVMRDLHKWFDPVTLRTIRSFAREFVKAPPDSSKIIVILTPSSEVPPEIQGHCVVIEYPIPDRLEMEKILDSIMDGLPEERREQAALTSDERALAVDAAVGLTAEEATSCYARSLVTRRKIIPEIVAGEKKRVITREGVMTWIDPDPRGLQAVGGLDLLKKWLAERQVAFGPAARAYGLPAPKGMLLLGIPGVGKSLVAKCIATAWQMPLLRLDLGALKSKWVGESEANIRKALQVAETVAPAIVWCDEIEKSLGGATQGAADGGVSSDALGVLLSWMQDRQAPTFVLATCNDVSALPPEMLRKGRFDELFFCDLPSRRDRAEIFKASVAAYPTTPFSNIDYDVLVAATETFTGAEIASTIPDAMFRAFADKARPVATKDILRAIETVVPLAKTAEEKITLLREWAKGRARCASTPEVIDAGTTRGAAIDFEDN